MVTNIEIKTGVIWYPGIEQKVLEGDGLVIHHDGGAVLAHGKAPLLWSDKAGSHFAEEFGEVGDDPVDALAGTGSAAGGTPSSPPSTTSPSCG